MNIKFQAQVLRTIFCILTINFLIKIKIGNRNKYTLKKERKDEF